MPLIDNLRQLLFSQLAIGVGLGLSIPIFVTWSLEAVAQEDRGVAASICFMGGSLGVFGPFVGGLVADAFSLDTTFAAVGVLCLISATWPIADALKLRKRIPTRVR